MFLHIISYLDNFILIIIYNDPRRSQSDGDSARRLVRIVCDSKMAMVLFFNADRMSSVS
jgi:hypothetical protein